MNAPKWTEEALRWLKFAMEDLRQAEILVRSEEAPPRYACWFAQQAAEKALKAALVLEGISFPFRHNLNALRDLLPAGWRVKDQYPDLSQLTVWAVEARYPGDWPEATREDADCAVLEARGVLESVVGDFRSRGVEVRGWEGEPWP